MLKDLNQKLALINAGSNITIEICTPAGQRKKFRSVYIGSLPKQYVLIQFPDSHKLGNFGQYIVQGTSITVRGLIEGREGAIVAFLGNIKKTLLLPSRIMVLDYPTQITLQNLRSSIRIGTKITAKIKIDNQFWQTTITDLSVNGCLLYIIDGESLILNENKAVEIIVESTQGLAGVKLNANICNIKQQVQGLSFGVKFADVSKEPVSKLLHHIIMFEE
jgi:c-di-GMP-binding flagellar brake protein YcgR